MVFYHVVESGVRSCWNMRYVYPSTLLPRNQDESNYTISYFCTVYTSLFSVWIIKRMNMTVIGSMKLVNENKFVMVGSWWRVEAGTNSEFNKTPVTLASMGFGVEFR